MIRNWWVSISRPLLFLWSLLISYSRKVTTKASVRASPASRREMRGLQGCGLAFSLVTEPWSSPWGGSFRWLGPSTAPHLELTETVWNISPPSLYSLDLRVCVPLHYTSDPDKLLSALQKCDLPL